MSHTVSDVSEVGAAALAPIGSICAITPNYPSPRFVERGAFVETLVSQWQAEGVAVDVVAPVSMANLLRDLRRPKHEACIAGDQILSPAYPTFSARSFGALDLRLLNRWFFTGAALRALRKTAVADTYYGKFLFGGGIVAARAGMRLNRPAFADLGESVFLEGMTVRERACASSLIGMLDGLVCVSERLREEAIELGAQPHRVLLAPNQADTGRFRPLDRQEVRARLSLPQDAFIVAFAGHFIERKGPLRVLAALERLDRPAFGVFLGRGPQKPEGARVLHAGPVPNADMPIWLNAADLLMLPTLAEGSCNAIAEALACGLPVISSDIPDVRWQVPRGGGILVNASDIGAIAAALQQAMDEPGLLAQMRDRLRRLYPTSSARKRGTVILDWMHAISMERGRPGR